MVRPREQCERLGFMKGGDGARQKTTRKKQVFQCSVLEWDV